MKNINSFYFALEQLHRRALVADRKLTIGYFGLGPIEFEVEGFSIEDEIVSIKTTRNNKNKVFRFGLHSTFQHKNGQNGLTYNDPLSNRKITVSNEPPELIMPSHEAEFLLKKYVAVGLLDFRREHPEINLDSLYNKGVQLKKFFKRVGFWWPSEELFLIRYHSTKGAKYCSYTMGKSHDSIKKKAARMGLKRSHDKIVFKASDNSYKDEEINFIKENISKIGLHQVGLHINRGIPSLRQKCIELDISISDNHSFINTTPAEPWSADEDKFLRNNVVNLGYRGVSDKLGRTYDAVHYRAKHIKSTIKEMKLKAG